MLRRAGSKPEKPMNAHSLPTTWSPQQDAALREVSRWLKTSSEQVFRLFGYAGTGKTTLAKEIASNVNGLVLYGAYTGKAAQVLRQKGCQNASTIHSMIYKYVENEDGTREFKLNVLSEVKNAKLVIIDECSMVDEEIGKDLLSFGTKVLVLGDPAQLPPVKGGGFFTDHEPHVMLTEVHRQARDNPIIELSMRVRERERLQRGDYGSVRIIDAKEVKTDEVLAADQILVGLNRTREQYNRRVRQLLGRTDLMPVPGDRLVCLKNNRENGLFNGSIWNFLRRQEIPMTDTHKFWIQSEDGALDVECCVLDACFDGTLAAVPWYDRRGYDEFTYGYALTVHKSQGSQWDNVFLFNESGAFREDASRWLYTGITRAAQKLTVVM